MRYEVFESAAAARDLEAGVSYLVDTLKSPSAANRLLDDYTALVEALEETPFAYPLVRDELLSFAGYRWASASSYMVFFTVDEERECVLIHRIAHESRNWVRLLR